MAEVYLGMGRAEPIIIPRATIATHTPEISTAAMLENILARCARIEARLIERERWAAATLPPLRPEPDPPDGPPWYAAAQPPPLPYTLPQTDPSSCWYTPHRREQPGYQHYSHHQPLTVANGQPPHAGFDSGVNNTGGAPPPTPTHHQPCWDPPFQQYDVCVRELRPPTDPELEMQPELYHIYPSPPPAPMPESYHYYPSLMPQPDDPYSHFQPSEELYPPVYNGEGYSSNSDIAGSLRQPQSISHPLQVMDRTPLPQFTGSETLGRQKTFHAGYQHGQQLFHQILATSVVDQPFTMASDAAAPPLQEHDRRMRVFAEMQSHLAVTDRHVDSLRPPIFPELEPPNDPPSLAAA